MERATGMHFNDSQNTTVDLFCTPYILSNPKQPSCKKKSAAPKKAMVKKDVKSKVAAKKWLR